MFVQKFQDRENITRRKLNRDTISIYLYSEEKGKSCANVGECIKTEKKRKRENIATSTKREVKNKRKRTETIKCG